jgi:glycerol-3-phosphate O-acyltransferase
MGEEREEMNAKSTALRWLIWVAFAAFVVAAGWLARWRVAAAGQRVTVRRLVDDPAVHEAAREHSRERGISLAAALRLAGGYVREISPSPDPRLYLRVAVPLARRVIRFLYGGRLRSGGMEDIPEPGGGSSVIFVMNHRSNLDYVVLGHLLGERVVPSFAAGEWASFWPLGPLVRAMGSFFVRRGSGDALYRRVLERFFQTELERGLTPVVFVEGGLSRDGRLREPKIGLLSYALRRFDPHGERDLIFVPVGINHDWILEDGSLPEPGEPHPSGIGSVFSTVLYIVRAVRLARRGPARLGYAAVRFGKPVSAREWARFRSVDLRSLNPEARVKQVREFARDLMRSVGGLVPVPPVPVVAHVFLESYEETLPWGEILSRSCSLVSDLERRGAWACVEEEAAIEAALSILVSRRLVVREGDHYRAAPENVKLLRFYAASISHHFPEDG